MGGMETLPLRMQKISDNALEVAKFLDGHEKVSWVRYGGLGDQTMRKVYSPLGAGGLFTFGLKGGYEVQMISLVANLGDARTLIAHPASMMHAQLTEEQRKAAG